MVHLAIWLALGCGPGSLQDVLDRRAQQLGAPGATMAVIVDGRTVFAGSTGKADLAQDEPMVVDERVRLGSLTKPFTAAVVLQLADEGAWTLDDPIDTWVEGVPNGGSIAIHHLLSHTSGLADYADLDRYWAQADQPWTRQELLELTYEESPVSSPGSNWHYSNSGYIVLALAAEQATGESWEALVTERIVNALGLEHTEVIPSGNRARGYATNEETGVFEDQTDHAHSDNSWAAGTLVSTAPDVALFAHALMTGGLVAEETVVAMSRRVELPGGEYRYGLGVGIDAYELGWSIGHQGKAVGYASSWSHRPELDTTIAVMMNTSDAGARKIEKEAWKFLQ